MSETLKTSELAIPDNRPDKFEIILDQFFLIEQDYNTLERFQLDLNRFISVCCCEGYDVVYRHGLVSGRVEKLTFKKTGNRDE